jgi:hypothetical protein
MKLRSWWLSGDGGCDVCALVRFLSFLGLDVAFANGFPEARVLIHYLKQSANTTQ